jgi:hypothetical protein
MTRPNKDFNIANVAMEREDEHSSEVRLHLRKELVERPALRKRADHIASA